VRRAPAEYTILVSFGAAVVFWGWLALFGSWRSTGSGYAIAVPVAGFFAIGIAACWLVLKRKTAGAWLCVIFYGIQVLTFPLPVGAPFKFNSLPTIYFRLNSDLSSPVSVNILAVVLFVVSLALLAHYRERDGRASQVPPNTSLERTREG
jgi:hypothetical protein